MATSPNGLAANRPTTADRRWTAIAAGLGGIALLLVITPILIIGNDSDFWCGSVLVKTGGGRQQHCEFIGAYRDRLVATYVVGGVGVIAAAAAIRGLDPDRRRRAVWAACLVVPALGLASMSAWRASDARRPSITVEPSVVDSPGLQTFVVTGQRFHDWPVVEIVECAVASSPRPCRAGAGVSVTPEDGRFEVVVTYDVPAEGVGIGAFSAAGDPLDLSWLVAA